VIPVLASFLLKRRAHDPWLMRMAAAPTCRLCAGAAPCASAGHAALARAGGGRRWSTLQVGKTFMPTMDEGDVIIVGIEKLPSVSLEQTAALDLRSRRR
jgi:cobalt-zinc-cadmium resistance protein CzcA